MDTCKFHQQTPRLFMVIWAKQRLASTPERLKVQLAEAATLTPPSKSMKVLSGKCQIARQKMQQQ